MSFSAIRGRIQKIREKEEIMSNDGAFCPPIDSYAFQIRLIWFEVAAMSGIDGVREELKAYLPEEIAQIMNLRESDWDADSWKQIAAVQNNIRAAMAE